MDGLAAGLIALEALAFFVISTMIGAAPGAVLSIILLGVTVGFLPHNFPKAKIFMGDTGSLFLGFMISAIAIVVLAHSAQLVMAASVVLVLGIPIFDICFAVLRRLYHHESVFNGDRNHIYDLLAKKGFSYTQTVVICWGMQFVLGCAGVLIVFLTT